MTNSDTQKKISNEIYFCFEESDNTLQDVLKASFLNYLELKEESEPFANKCLK
jgi:hypothetical protein